MITFLKLPSGSEVLCDGAESRVFIAKRKGYYEVYTLRPVWFGGVWDTATTWHSNRRYARVAARFLNKLPRQGA